MHLDGEYIIKVKFTDMGVPAGLYTGDLIEHIYLEQAYASWFTGLFCRLSFPSQMEKEWEKAVDVLMMNKSHTSLRYSKMAI